MDDLNEAISMLESPNLIWSDDFEAIRHHLWALLRSEQTSLAPHQATLDLAEALVDDFNNNLAVG